MMKPMSLNGTWDLFQGSLGDGPEAAATITRSAARFRAPVPGDIREALIRKGAITEPLTGGNSFTSCWIEKHSWWYRKTFAAPADWKKADRIELELDGLDVAADVFLNGKHLGRHPSVFRPFVGDVTESLKPGRRNEVLVRLTAGLDSVAAGQLRSAEWIFKESGIGSSDRGDIRRVLLRKPQYSFGWDWGPRVATCGIAFNALLRPIAAAEIRSLHPSVVLDNGVGYVTVEAEVDVPVRNTLLEGELSVALTDRAGRKFKAVVPALWKAGLNYVQAHVVVPAPRLWWPAGAGEQHLYTLAVSARVGRKSAARSISWGMRTVELDAAEDRFALRVNGQRLFAKGANWVPADSIYARIRPAKYEALLREAVNANFNILRIWGGGFYERDLFYETCDRLGLMVWQDFMFACGSYPDYLEWFRDEVGREADYQTKRLRRHACVVILAGNNECHAKEHGIGCGLYDYLLPQAAHRNCPEIPYWNGSPYGGEHPNMDEYGDCHHWHWAGHPDLRERVKPENYDVKERLLFASEYGYVGPCSKTSTQQYLGTDAIDMRSPEWMHHTNVWVGNVGEGALTVGIRAHYRDTDGLSADDFLLYGGLCQAQMLGYSLDAFRFRPVCHGAMFWMYADCWGEVGWTIVDYYLRRKISFYAVKRALAPARLILRRKPDGIHVTLSNHAPSAAAGILEAGWVALDGTSVHRKTARVNVPAFGREVVMKLPLKTEQPGGMVFARVRGSRDILPATLKPEHLRELGMQQPDLKAALAKRQGPDRLAVTVRSDVYAHAVHLVLSDDARLSDNYFDLLPGESRTIVAEDKGAGRLNKLTLRSIVFAGGGAQVFEKIAAL